MKYNQANPDHTVSRSGNRLEDKSINKTFQIRAAAQQPLQRSCLLPPPASPPQSLSILFTTGSTHNKQTFFSYFSRGPTFFLLPSFLHFPISSSSSSVFRITESSCDSLIHFPSCICLSEFVVFHQTFPLSFQISCPVYF